MVVVVVVVAAAAVARVLVVVFVVVTAAVAAGETGWTVVGGGRVATLVVVALDGAGETHAAAHVLTNSLLHVLGSGQSKLLLFRLQRFEDIFRTSGQMLSGIKPERRL